MAAPGFEERLKNITNQMAEGFADAYSLCPTIQQIGTIDHGVETNSILRSTGDIEITTILRGDNVELFGRTFSDALKLAGVSSKRDLIHSPKTGQDTDREITFSVPANATETFLTKLEEVKDFVVSTKPELTRLYESGIKAKHTVKGTEKEELLYYVLPQLVGEKKYGYRLGVYTNNQSIMIKAVRAMPSEHDIRLLTPEININEPAKAKPNEPAVATTKPNRHLIYLQALTEEGNKAIEHAIAETFQERGVGTKVKS